MSGAITGTKKARLSGGLFHVSSSHAFFFEQRLYSKAAHATLVRPFGGECLCDNSLSRRAACITLLFSSTRRGEPCGVQI
jgi:hypothetical protein